MKVISIKNPYAYMIAYGIKNVENRSWKTEYRGELFLHASGLPMIDIPDNYYPNEIIDLYNEYCDVGLDHGDKAADKFLAKNPVLQKIYNLDMKIIAEKKKQNLYLQPKCIIGKATLVNIVRDSNSPFADFGSYHWIFENPILFEKPILNIPGHLKLWDFDYSLPIK